MRPIHSNKKFLVVLFALLFLSTISAWAQTAPADATKTGDAGSPAKSDASTGKTEDKGYVAAKSTSQDGVPAKPDTRPVEDWNTLAVPSDLRTNAPVSLAKTTERDFTRELLQVEFRPGDRFDLYITKPLGVKNPPVILYLYSFPSDTDHFRGFDFGSLATDDGFAGVGFVSALTGHRFHDRPQRTWFVSELQESMASSVHDVQLILNYLATRGDLDMTRVAMYGEGSGASIAIMAAAVDPRIKALDLFSPWGDWPDWLAKSTLVPENERADYLKPEFLKKVENVDPVKWLPQLTTQKIRLQFLRTGTITPPAAMDHIEAVAPSGVKVVHYENTQAVRNFVATGTEYDWVKFQIAPEALAQDYGGAVVPAKPAQASKHPAQ